MIKDCEEVWKPCPGFETKYLISNLGNIKSIGTYNTCKNNQLIKQYKKHDKNDYMQVRLYDNGRAKTIEVHTLVAKAFIPNPSNLPMVNHKDENKSNNIVSNLEWCDNQYNIRYSRGRAVCQYDKITRRFIKEYPTITDASEELNIPIPNISKCCKGQRQSAGGYIFLYKSDINILKQLANGQL